MRKESPPGHFFTRIWPGNETTISVVQVNENECFIIHCKNKIVVLDNYYNCVTVLPTLIQRTLQHFVGD